MNMIIADECFVCSAKKFRMKNIYNEFIQCNNRILSKGRRALLDKLYVLPS